MNELIDTIALGIIVLLGEQGVHWDYFQDTVDDNWWELRLWIIRN